VTRRSWNRVQEAVGGAPRSGVYQYRTQSAPRVAVAVDELVDRLEEEAGVLGFDVDDANPVQYSGGEL
jgi:hypothetical protein